MALTPQRDELPGQVAHGPADVDHGLHVAGVGQAAVDDLLDDVGVALAHGRDHGLGVALDRVAGGRPAGLDDVGKLQPTPRLARLMEEAPAFQIRAGIDEMGPAQRAEAVESGALGGSAAPEARAGASRRRPGASARGRLGRRPVALHQPFAYQRLEDDLRGARVGACRLRPPRAAVTGSRLGQRVDDPGAQRPGHQEQPFYRPPIHQRFPHARSNSSPAAVHSFELRPRNPTLS